MLRELFRKNKHLIPGGYDLIISPRAGFLEQKWDTLQQTFLRIIPILTSGGRK